MLPICAHCRTEMRCLKNAISVAYASNPHKHRTGDKYGCEDCGNEIIIGFGTGQNKEQFPDILIEEPRDE